MFYDCSSVLCSVEKEQKFEWQESQIKIIFCDREVEYYHKPHISSSSLDFENFILSKTFDSDMT